MVLEAACGGTAVPGARVGNFRAAPVVPRAAFDEEEPMFCILKVEREIGVRQWRRSIVKLGRNLWFAAESIG